MTVAVIDRNDVLLRGRLSAPAELRTLPSGDPLVTFRIIVRRTDPRTRNQVDVLFCVSYDRSLQRRVAAWQPGDVVEVEGALQRRFWRTPGGRASMVEVNCRRGRKVGRPAAPADRTA
jgi:single-strand DNA-binding protein